MGAISVQVGVAEAHVCRLVLQPFHSEIGAGLGAFAGKVWRIGLMGYASRAENVLICVSALEAILSQHNASIHRGVAVDAVQAVYDAGQD